MDFWNLDKYPPANLLNNSPAAIMDDCFKSSTSVRETPEVSTLRDQKIEIATLREVFSSMDKLGVDSIGKLCELRIEDRVSYSTDREITKARVVGANINWLAQLSDASIKKIKKMVEALKEKQKEIGADRRSGVWEFTDVPIIKFDNPYNNELDSWELVSRGGGLYLKVSQYRSEDERMMSFNCASETEQCTSKWQKFVQPEPVQSELKNSR